jgi:hypothetical protein
LIESARKFQATQQIGDEPAASRRGIDSVRTEAAFPVAAPAVASQYA